MTQLTTNQLILLLDIYRGTFEFGRHLAFDLELSYFVAGPFLEATGEAADSLHVAPTVSFKF